MCKVWRAPEASTYCFLYVKLKNSSTVVQKMHSVTFYHKGLKQLFWLRNRTQCHLKIILSEKNIDTFVPFCPLYYCAIILARLGKSFKLSHVLLLFSSESKIGAAERDCLAYAVVLMGYSFSFGHKSRCRLVQLGFLHICAHTHKHSPVSQWVKQCF